MSLERFRTGEKPSPCLTGEGRGEEVCQQPEPSERSGGVGVDGTSASSDRVSWEVSGGGLQARPVSQAGSASEAGGAAGEVGVSHSKQVVEALDAYFRGEWLGRRPRGDTCSKRPSEAKDTGMAGATRIGTPDKVRQLQLALYRKAKAEPGKARWQAF